VTIEDSSLVITGNHLIISQSENDDDTTKTTSKIYNLSEIEIRNYDIKYI
jgi:hypothetical protein